jgi:hypothetical protein
MTDSLTASVQHDGRDYSHENVGRASFAGDHHVIQV